MERLSTKTNSLYVVLILLLSGCVQANSQGSADTPIALAIHGGAGTITRATITPEQESAIRAKLEEALDKGYAILQSGGSSLDAVEQTLHILEDSPLFNAAHGAVFTYAGEVELDASIMDGATRNAGAIAGVKTVRNPISLARRVMESSPHVMLTGQGAEAFAEEQGLDLVPNSYFHTPFRRGQLERAQQDLEGTAALSHEVNPDYKYGTVGAVALDQMGNLAAATSTGGMTNKRYGRVGDSPIIGSGTYADNATCAISATGHGEYFIRGVIAHDVAAMMRYGQYSLEKASQAVIMDKLTEMGGTGGIIAVDAEGHIAMPFNTEGMYRASMDKDGNKTIAIYR